MSEGEKAHSADSKDIVVFIIRRDTKCAECGAVTAHIRHEHTPYDELLMKHRDRAKARELVRGEIQKVLDRWEQYPKPEG